jgi:hypothetical protein
MPRSVRNLTLVVAALAAAAAVAAPSHADARLSLVYDTSDVVARLVSPGAGAGLTPERGALRQDPGTGGMLAPGDNAPYRVSKVDEKSFLSMTAAQIADVLKGEITEGKDGAMSHLVAIDEIGRPFGEMPPARPTRGAKLAPVDPNSLGARFSAAMALLAAEESPWGGTWASRVHVYLAPGVVTSIGVGRGTERNLGRDGKPHRPTWRGVMPGLAQAGGVHLQMYHGLGGVVTAFTAAEWRASATGVVDLLARYGGDSSRVHFLFSSTAIPAGATRCADAQECSWKLAESTPAGRTILANGPGVYRIGADAENWMREFNRRFA